MLILYPSTLMNNSIELALSLIIWDFPGKNTRVGCHFLPDPEIEPGSPTW